MTAAGLEEMDTKVARVTEPNEPVQGSPDWWRPEHPERRAGTGGDRRGDAMKLYEVVVTTISEYTVLAESQEQAEDVIQRWVDDGRPRTVPGY